MQKCMHAHWHAEKQEAGKAQGAVQQGGAWVWTKAEGHVFQGAFVHLLCLMCWVSEAGGRALAGWLRSGAPEGDCITGGADDSRTAYLPTEAQGDVL